MAAAASPGFRTSPALPRLTERLLAEGYSETDLADIWGGNALRLLKAAEDHARNPSHRPLLLPATRKTDSVHRRTRLGSTITPWL